MQNSKATVLLAEDDLSLAFMIKDSLEEEGFGVIHCRDGQIAIDNFDKTKIDICLLDIMMPHKDGFLVARKIRQQSDVIPIIFLSTKAHEADRLKGYETGADDYLIKPFSMKELLKKMDVFLRRTKKMHAESPQEYQLNSMKFSYTEQKVLKADEILNITQKESELLKFFCDHPNRVIKREEVLINVWGKDDFFLGRSMDVYITKLRKILRGDNKVVLETIHGVGYRFAVLEEE